MVTNYRDTGCLSGDSRGPDQLNQASRRAIIRGISVVLVAQQPGYGQ
jgi:hypothetical protein